MNAGDARWREQVRVAVLGRWRHVAHVIHPAHGADYEWIVERFPDREDRSLGEDKAWGSARSQEDAVDQATSAFDEIIARETGRLT